MTTGHAFDIVSFLTENITDELPITVEIVLKVNESKSFFGFPHFYLLLFSEIKNIIYEQGNDIIERRDRGQKFMNERFL